jgi:SAM-dependent methyltransferase
MDKPFAPSAARNRDAILDAIRGWLTDVDNVLELGAGSGQHAVHFAAALPHLRWQASDLAHCLPGIEVWRAEAGLANLLPARELDVARRPWPRWPCDAIYAANLLHYARWPALESLFGGIGEILPPGGLVLVYGPFHYRGEAISEGNRALDAWLADVDPGYAIRWFDEVDALACGVGLELCEDRRLPANNHLLVWRRST